MYTNSTYCFMRYISLHICYGVGYVLLLVVSWAGKKGGYSSNRESLVRSLSLAGLALTTKKYYQVWLHEIYKNDSCWTALPVGQQNFTTIGGPCNSQTCTPRASKYLYPCQSQKSCRRWYPSLHLNTSDSTATQTQFLP